MLLDWEHPDAAGYVFYPGNGDISIRNNRLRIGCYRQILRFQRPLFCYPFATLSKFCASCGTSMAYKYFILLVISARFERAIPRLGRGLGLILPIPSPESAIAILA